METDQIATPTTKQKPRSPLKAQAHEAAEAHHLALTILGQVLDAFIIEVNAKEKKASLLRVTLWIEQALAELRLTVSATNKIQGMSADFPQSFFRQVCQRGVGQELGRRQRTELVRPFNRVREVLNKHLSAPLDRVINYNRAPRSLAIASRPNAFIPPSPEPNWWRTSSAQRGRSTRNRVFSPECHLVGFHHVNAKHLDRYVRRLRRQVDAVAIQI